MQIIAIAGSVILFLFILNLIRRKRIKEEYSLLWVFFGIVFIVLSLWRQGLDYIAMAIGVAYPPTAILLIFLMAMFMILIQFSIIISRLSDANKTLCQEIGLMKMELAKMKDEKKDHPEA
jgi:hypothetical protein